jgi:pimeloyl-ACP methyl ester carboxylesterase
VKTQEAPGNAQADPEQSAARSASQTARRSLLSGMPVEERRLMLAGVETAVLEGGDGPPVVLLHGPGEFAGKWLRVIPALAQTNRVIAPDLPAHGASEVPDGPLDAARIHAWLDDLIARTCASPPALVGHVLGGAIGARFASERGERLSRLVLVDTLGLSRFRPAPKFALTMLAFQARPSERSYNRFMQQCSFDLDGLRQQLGEQWEPFVSYNLDRARAPSSKVVGRLLRELGFPPIPPEELARIAVPTSLIWGRHDRANRLRIAEAASARYGWPLHVIENCADDPPRDQPAAFLQALRAVLSDSETHGGNHDH